MTKLITNSNYLNKKIILQSLREDIGSGDVTTLATINKSKILFGQFFAKDNGIVSGLNVVEEIFTLELLTHVTQHASC